MTLQETQWQLDAIVKRIDELEHRVLTVETLAKRMEARLAAQRPPIPQELSDAMLTLRQMSSALEDMVRRGTK